MSKVDVFSFSMTWDYIDFQTGHFADDEQFKVDSHSADFGQVKTYPTCSF